MIDSDYRGEVKVLIFNYSDEDIVIEKGDELCYLIIHKIADVNMVEVDDLCETKRGEGGFGSTGLNENK